MMTHIKPSKVQSERMRSPNQELMPTEPNASIFKFSLIYVTPKRQTWKVQQVIANVNELAVRLMIPYLD